MELLPLAGNKTDYLRVLLSITGSFTSGTPLIFLIKFENSTYLFYVPSLRFVGVLSVVELVAEPIVLRVVVEVVFVI